MPAVPVLVYEGNSRSPDLARHVGAASQQVGLNRSADHPVSLSSGRSSTVSNVARPAADMDEVTATSSFQTCCSNRICRFTAEDKRDGPPGVAGDVELCAGPRGRLGAGAQAVAFERPHKAALKSPGQA